MKRLQAFKYELMPDGGQERCMARFAGACRFVFNKALALQRANYEAGGKYINYVAMAKQLTAWRQGQDEPWLKDAPIHPLQHALKDLDRAYQNFFGKRAAFPRFKRKGMGESFRYPDAKQFEVDQANARIKLPKLGWVRYRKSRDVLGTPKNITVSMSAGKWFASIQTEREVQQPIPAASSSVGVDMGIARFATFSDGSFAAPRSSFKAHEMRLARYQRAMSRKRKGSKNWKKAKARLSRCHQRIANVRKDFLHKASSALAKGNALVCIEDLQVKSMSGSAKGTASEPGKNVAAKRGLNKSILDQGWFEFRRQLEYKLNWSGGMLLAVPAHHTSQTCPHCGHVSKDNRKTQSLFLCVACGHTGNADHIAAINILERGHRLLACGEGVRREALARAPSAASVKQEPTEVTTNEASHA
ncbi:MAG: RNA-guided endonuclease InsQ/TnpB family protein [Brachymonas sp.]